MQKFFDELIGKILWGVFILVLLVGGYNFLVRSLIKPPQINSPVTNSIPLPKNPNLLPALSQEKDVMLEAPKKLEKGGILKIYQNIDRNLYPNPLRYNPSEIIKTDGIELISLAKDKHLFQEASGYFIVEENSHYNFSLNTPPTWKEKRLKIDKLNIKIDGFILEFPRGGEIYLEKGWHKISLFSQLDLEGEYISISWQEKDKPIKPVRVWREPAYSSKP